MSAAKTLEAALLSCAIAALLALIARAPDAFAHAFPDSSQPSAGSMVAQAPPQAEVHFDGAIDPSASRLRVLNKDGDDMSAAKAAVSGDHRGMTVPLKPLAPGQYFVKWSARSSDGDRTMGAFSFTVSGPAPH